MAEVRLENLRKRFEGTTAVSDISLTIADGEFLALLGPSGCGKTTTLRMIAALEQPTSGRIHIGGRDVTKIPAQRRDVAMVFQDYALYPHMTVGQNVGYPLKVRRRSRTEIERRTAEVAGVLGLVPLLARRPGQLSGGQQQRAAVARSLVYEPQALLLDEPLSNLDAKLRLEARSFLRGFQRRLKITTIYVTHDQAEAMALADRIAVMEEGRVQQLGPPLDVYRRPASTFVASFIGSPAMNLLRGEIADGCLVAPGMRIEAASLRTVQSNATVGDRLQAGIRPEHLRLAGERETVALEGQAFAIEPLGAETLVHLRAGEQELVMRLAGDRETGFDEGETIRLACDQDHVLWYGRDGRLLGA